MVCFVLIKISYFKWVLEVRLLKIIFQLLKNTLRQPLNVTGQVPETRAHLLDTVLAALGRLGEARILNGTNRMHFVRCATNRGIPQCLEVMHCKL